MAFTKAKPSVVMAGKAMPSIILDAVDVETATLLSMLYAASTGDEENTQVVASTATLAPANGGPKPPAALQVGCVAHSGGGRRACIVDHPTVGSPGKTPPAKKKAKKEVPETATPPIKIQRAIKHVSFDLRVECKPLRRQKRGAVSTKPVATRVSQRQHEKQLRQQKQQDQERQEERHAQLPALYHPTPSQQSAKRTRGSHVAIATRLTA
jgi:hypothetical protein